MPFKKRRYATIPTVHTQTTCIHKIADVSQTQTIHDLFTQTDRQNQIQESEIEPVSEIGTS